MLSSWKVNIAENPIAVMANGVVDTFVAINYVPLQLFLNDLNTRPTQQEILSILETSA